MCKNLLLIGVKYLGLLNVCFKKKIWGYEKLMKNQWVRQFLILNYILIKRVKFWKNSVFNFFLKTLVFSKIIFY